MEDIAGVLVAVAVIYFGGSYLMRLRGGGNATPNGTPGAVPASLRGVTPAMVEQISAMFPHVGHTAIIYDLSRTRSAQRTSERILERGGLPPPPATFVPPPSLLPVAQRLAAQIPSAASTSTSVTASSKPATKPQTLLERYQLSEAQATTAVLDSDETSTTFQNNAAKWEPTAEEREKSLKARKEAMILEARRRLIAKQKAAAEAST